MPEARVDAVGTTPLVLVGGGLFTDAGLNLRVGATLGVAAASRAAEGALVVRYLLDPLRVARRGVYAGVGVGTRGWGSAWGPFLTGVVGVEGRGGARVVPAAELGVGGGVRVAVVLRRARLRRR